MPPIAPCRFRYADADDAASLPLRITLIFADAAAAAPAPSRYHSCHLRRHAGEFFAMMRAPRIVTRD